MRTKTQPYSLRRLFFLAFRCFSFSALVVRAQDESTGPAPTSPAAPSTSAEVPSTAFTPGSASGYVGMAPSTPFAGTSQLSVSPPSTLQSALTAGGGLVQLGPVAVRPHLAYDVSYGNNLEYTPGQQINTVINQVSPGILLTLGDHWSLDYTPTMLFYSSRKFQDAVNQNVNFNGGTTYEDWSFGLQQGYSSTSEPLIETGSQIDQETFSTALVASHPLNSKVSLDFNLNQNFRYISEPLVLQNLSDSREWSTMEWLNYQFVPRFTVGVGVGFTYDNLSVGPDMTSEQYQGRIVWRASDKLNFLVTGGLEDRQFLSTGAPDLLSPLFSLSAQYQLFEATSFSLTASRSVFPAYFEYALAEATMINGGVHQRLLEKLYLDVNGGYSTTTYHATSSIFGPGAGNFGVTSFNVRLSTILLKRATAALYFQENFISSNSSGAASALYNYTTTQVGLSLAYRF